MQSFDTNSGGQSQSDERAIITVGRVEDVTSGRCVTVELSNGNELALYNVNGDFYATNNFCPHKGAPLAEGRLRGHTIECDWHGWEFDVRTGRCLNTSEKVEVFKVFVEDGWIKIEL